MNAQRRASAMVVTLGVTFLIAMMLVAATEITHGVHRMQAVELESQKASYAAEAVGALQEVKLVNLAATNDLRALASMTNQPIGSPSEGTWQGMEYFGGCMVRWRIEPVLIESSDNMFTVNPSDDPSRPPPNDPSYMMNHDFYNFRISTEAYALPDAEDYENPWDNPEHRSAIAQATRMVQLRLNSLFRYAIFYAAEGAEGDLEMWAGTTVDVDGAVHSNGAIFLGGQGQAYTSGNYHNASSGGGSQQIGSAARRTTVVGVDGIYRMRKGSLLWASRNTSHPLYNSAFDPATDPDLTLFDVPNPMTAPPELIQGGGWTAPLTHPDTGAFYAATLNWRNNPDVNGDSPGSARHSINGIAFHSANDSRNPREMETDFSIYARDGVTRGASVVKTLSNIPHLGGRPFEDQVLTRAGAAIYVLDPGRGRHDLTVVPGAFPLPGRYYVNPGADDYSFTDSPGPNSQAVDEVSARLWWTDGPFSTMKNWFQIEDDIANSITHPNLVPVDGGGRPLYLQTGDWDGLRDITVPTGSTGLASFNSRAVLGHYLSIARNGDGDGTYGILIRERAERDAAAPPTPPGPDANYSGGDAMIGINPDGRIRDSFFTNLTDAEAGNVPQISYNVSLSPGDWQVLIRAHGHADFTAGASTQNWLQVALYDSGGNLVDNGSGQTPDGNDPSTAMSTSPRYGWGPQANINLSVPAAGDYVFRIYMDYEAVAIDKIILASGSNSNNRRTLGRDTNGGMGVDPSPVVGGVYQTVAHHSYGISYVCFEAEEYHDIETGGDWIFMPVSGAYEIEYAASQLVVEFGAHDITRRFLLYGLTTGVSDLTVAEHRFVDMRQARSMQVFFQNNGMAFNPVDIGNGDPYRIHTYTLDVGAAVDFIRNTPWSTINPTAPDDGTMASERFNGLIYAHRTRRSMDTSRWQITSFGAGGYSIEAHPDLADAGLGTFRPGRYLNATPGKNYYRFPPSGFVLAQYPADVRSGDGPPETYRHGFRFTNAQTVDWGGINMVDATTTRSRGLTIVTPNRSYVWGDYNTTMVADSAGTPQLPPCAIFADSITALSNNWEDNAHQIITGSLTNAATTTYNYSVVINNAPTDVWNGADEGSGAVANVVRFLENWGGRTYNFMGSLVVMAKQRYTYDTLGASAISGADSINVNTRYYSPPSRNITFNDDLLSTPGQPPFTPFGVQVIRTVQTVQAR